MFKPALPFKPDNAFELYWYFVSERHAMLERRLAGKPREEWTTDPHLSAYRFTNVYRVEDYVSQYLLRNVLYHVRTLPNTCVPLEEMPLREPHTPEDVFFRVMLFKLFNKPETWELLTRERYDFTVWENAENHLDVIDRGLAAAKTHTPIYSAAYVMPAAPHPQKVSKHRSHLELLWKMMHAGVPAQLAECSTFSKALAVLQRWPIMGDFLASQFLLDLDYSEAFNFEQDVFPAGPGARSGIVKCFPNHPDLTRAGVRSEYRTQAYMDVIRGMHANQDAHLKSLGLPFNRLYNLPLALNDIQNCFCETDKLARVAMPHVQGLGDRTVVKQKFAPRPVAYESIVVPPKWLRRRE